MSISEIAALVAVVLSVERRLEMILGHTHDMDLRHYEAPTTLTLKFCARIARDCNDIVTFQW